MTEVLPLHLIIFLGITILAGLIYLLATSYRSGKKEGQDTDDDDDDPEWRAKRFWWFGR